MDKRCKIAGIAERCQEQSWSILAARNLSGIQEEHLTSMLEIVEIERYVSRNIRNYRNPGRKPHERKFLARAFVAKALYRHKTTSDLLRALQSSVNLCRICGFSKLSDIPSESTFSRAFSEFYAHDIGGLALNALAGDYLSQELVGHISRDSTAITGREKPALKVIKEPQKKINEVVLPKGNNAR